MLQVLVFFVFHLSNTYKMIQVPGTVIDEPSGLSLNPTSCMNVCLMTSECFLVYTKLNGECISLNNLSPYQVNLTNDQRFVAFKTDSNDTTCPLTYQDVIFSVTMSDGFLYSWDRNSTSFSFNGCRSDWTRFERNNSESVCMKIFIQSQITYNDTKEQCLNQSSKLTGVATKEECVWIQNSVNQLTSKAWWGFWIDGVRSCDPGVSCMNFTWTDGYTTSYDMLDSSNAVLASGIVGEDYENCLSIGYMPAPQTINDVRCVSDTYLILGYVCGYKIEN